MKLAIILSFFLITFQAFAAGGGDCTFCDEGMEAGQGGNSGTILQCSYLDGSNQKRYQAVNVADVARANLKTENLVALCSDGIADPKSNVKAIGFLDASSAADTTTLNNQGELAIAQTASSTQAVETESIEISGIGSISVNLTDINLVGQYDGTVATPPANACLSLCDCATNETCEGGLCTATPTFYPADFNGGNCVTSCSAEGMCVCLDPSSHGYACYGPSGGGAGGAPCSFANDCMKGVCTEGGICKDVISGVNVCTPGEAGCTMQPISVGGGVVCNADGDGWSDNGMACLAKPGDRRPIPDVCDCNGGETNQYSTCSTFSGKVAPVNRPGITLRRLKADGSGWDIYTWDGNEFTDPVSGGTCAASPPACTGSCLCIEGIRVTSGGPQVCQKLSDPCVDGSVGFELVNGNLLGERYCSGGTWGSGTGAMCPSCGTTDCSADCDCATGELCYKGKCRDASVVKSPEDYNEWVKQASGEILKTNMYDGTSDGTVNTCGTPCNNPCDCSPQRGKTCISGQCVDALDGGASCVYPNVYFTDPGDGSMSQCLYCDGYTPVCSMTPPACAGGGGGEFR